MRTQTVAALLAMVLTLGACGNFDAPNQNFGTLDDLTSGTPSRVAVTTATQGLFASMRAAPSTLFWGGMVGREAYNLDVSNPDTPNTVFVTPNLIFAFWAGYYRPAHFA